METMKNPITIANLFTCDTQVGDANGVIVDMQQAGGYEAALALVSLGALTGSPTAVDVSFEEGDESDLSDGVVMDGGAAQTVVADTQYSFQLKRTKRYFRMVLAFTGGTTPSAEIAAQAVLNNWAKPFNVR